MRRYRQVVPLFLILMGALSLSSAALAAPPPEEASGTLHVGASRAALDHESGGNQFWTVNNDLAFTGTFAGGGTSEYRQIIHPDGRFNNVGEVVCVCTVEGVGTGTIVIRTTVTGNLLTGELHGSGTVIAADGDLAGLQSHSKIELDPRDPRGATFLYSGRYHFAPHQ